MAATHIVGNVFFLHHFPDIKVHQILVSNSLDAVKFTQGGERCYEEAVELFCNEGRYEVPHSISS